ncbi:hypothetical protein NIES2107_39330 [Nostoc carneum NIES-2107]|nr:hypothetical protein NIES2107_39330 [Nostoc carneum NIES-2107]
MNLSRRNFFKVAGASAVGVTMLSPLEALYAGAAKGKVANGIGYGPLEAKLPQNADELVDVVFGGINLGNQPLLELPPGFKYTAISYTGQRMDDGALVASNHDGMAAFEGRNRNSTILVRNHEVSANGSNPIIGLPRYDQIGGGTTTIIVGPDRRVKKQFVSLSGTIRNCAGGPTPWDSWISCEENLTLPTPGGASKKHGYNFEVPATENIQIADPIPLVAMGRFNHEAVAVDPKTGWIYQTEDDGSSCFYRFRPHVRPTRYGDLQKRGAGVLEALVVKGKPRLNTSKEFPVTQSKSVEVEWVTIDNVDPNDNSFASSVRGQGQAKGAAIFSRGEGAWYGDGNIYFTCTNGGAVGQGQVFAYNPRKNTLTLVVESPAENILNFPDNITVAPFGDLFLCEDGSNTEYVIGVNQKGELYRFAANAINGSEFAGACFSPDGRTMFVNIQDPGITCAIWGPWNRKRA